MLPNQKPPIGSRLDLGHPLAQGLVAGWLLNEGSGKPVDVTGKFPFGAFNASWLPDGIRNGASSSYFGAVAKGLSRLTIFATFRFTSIVAWSTMFDNIATSRSASLGTNVAGNKLVFTVKTDVQTTVTGGTTLVANRKYSGCGTYNGSEVAAYLNGKLDVTPAAKTGNSFSYDANSFFSVGTNVDLFTVMVYNRALSADEIRQLHELTAGW